MPPPMFDRVGDALLLLRLTRRLSQLQVAATSGIQSNQLSRYETGAVKPQLAQLGRLLTALGVGLPEFVFAMAAVERIASFVADADQRQPAAVIAADAASRYWQNVAEQHVAVAAQVTQYVQRLRGADV